MAVSAKTVLNVFINTLNVIGERDMIELLATASKTGGNQKYIEFLIIETSRELDVSTYKLRNPERYTLTGRLKSAISCICYIAIKHLRYSHNDVSTHILHNKNANRFTSCKYKKYIDNLDPKHPEEKPIYNALTNIEIKFLAYMEDQNKKAAIEETDNN